MIFVTSQQVVIPGEELAPTETTKYEFLSWSLKDVLAFTNDMSDNEKHKFSRDFEGLLTKNFSLTNATETFEDVVKAKYWIFGGSARWMFGLTSERAWSDLLDFFAAVYDVEKLQNGLSGDRSHFAVNPRDCSVLSWSL
jgi:hypothetical protein